MKFALFEFCEDNSCEVGSSNWIVNEDETGFNNEVWISNKQVLVDWPLLTKDYSKWAKKSGKCALDGTCETKTYAARVLKFNDSYDALLKVLATYLETGNTQTPLRGRGKRESKKNDRYKADSSDDEEMPVQPAKKPKTNRSVSNSTISYNYISMLKEKLPQKEKLGEDNLLELESSDEEIDEVTKMQKKLVAKNREIKELKNKMQKMKDLQDVMLELKDSVANLKKLAATTCRCNAREENVPPVVQVSEKKCPAPPHVIPKEELEESNSENDIDNVKLCPGITVTRGQLKILKSKHSPKEFVYALLPMVWTREVLSTHSVSGRQSNAHKGRDAKPQLDVAKVDSICNYVAQKFGSTPKEIKKFCASKMNNIVKCAPKAEK